MGYLNQSQEDLINEAFNTLHYNFADRNLFYAVSEGTKTIISKSPDHNAFYPNSSTNSETVTVKESGVFSARLRYPRDSDNFNRLNFAGNNQDIGAKTAENHIRIITDITGHNLLKNAKDIYWDDNAFKVDSTSMKHGLLQKNFYTYYLEEVK